MMRAVDAVADALGDAGEANHRAFRDDATRIATALERTLTRDEDADAFAVLGVEHTVSMWTACVDAWTRAAETREATRATAATLRDVAAAARDAERAWAAKRARGVARELEEVELRHDARVRQGEGRGAKSATRRTISSGGDGGAGRARRRGRGERGRGRRGAVSSARGRVFVARGVRAARRARGERAGGERAGVRAGFEGWARWRSR